ncbi:hypothetical protein HDV57DRAFT_314277 [Trichoderma longibrachiatum]|uniref:Uncharacterized protein n=1 Tax=Trichoderma longibrachiatum ATCC 18648 TaxID=983965 RepID=A0A2T4CBL3_TRILO|nr:hypothetical protein M440DRAFT_1156328 [Trichoderma longibrachiatum ATCC 18648]
MGLIDRCFLLALFFSFIDFFFSSDFFTDTRRVFDVLVVKFEFSALRAGVAELADRERTTPRQRDLFDG